jgi:hypothetical protein
VLCTERTCSITFRWVSTTGGRVGQLRRLVREPTVPPVGSRDAWAAGCGSDCGETRCDRPAMTRVRRPPVGQSAPPREGDRDVLFVLHQHPPAWPLLHPLWQATTGGGSGRRRASLGTSSRGRHSTGHDSARRGNAMTRASAPGVPSRAEGEVRQRDGDDGVPNLTTIQDLYDTALARSAVGGDRSLQRYAAVLMAAPRAS